MRHVHSEALRAHARHLIAEGVTPDQIVELGRRLGYSIKRESSLVSFVRPCARTYIVFGTSSLDVSDHNPKTLISFIEYTLTGMGYPCRCTANLDYAEKKARFRISLGIGIRPVTAYAKSEKDVAEAEFTAAMQAFLNMLVLLPAGESLQCAA